MEDKDFPDFDYSPVMGCSIGAIEMKHRVRLLAALPFLLAFASFAEAGFRCGGCSDPCRTRSAARSGWTGSGPAMHGYGASVVQANSGSCGSVGADGSYLGGFGNAGYSNVGYAANISYAFNAVAVAAGGCGAVASYAPAVSFAPAAAYAPAVSYTQVQMAGPSIVCEPVTGYRTVMESTFVTETQYVTATETKQEVRQRVRQVNKSVPVSYEDYRVKTVTVPKTETKTIEYSVLIPEQSTKTVTVNVTVPVWNEISENYTVKVPVISDVQETYQVKVPRLRDETFTYTVYVPQTESVTKMQTVTNAVPVVKTRTVQRTVPKYSTQTVTKDYGHWETVVEEVAGSSYAVAAAPVVSYGGGCGTHVNIGVGGGCGSNVFASGCGSSVRRCGSGSIRSCGSRSMRSGSCGCGSPVSCGQAVASGYGYGSVSSGCGVVNSGDSYDQAIVSAPITTTRRVWVPSVVMEEIAVVTNDVVNEEMAYTVYEQQSTQVPYESTYVVYRPEIRTGTKKVVDQAMEERTRTRKVVSYSDEQRTRTRREVSYKTEAKEESYPVVSYRTEKRTKEISFTVNELQQTVEPFQATRMETTTEDVIENYTVNVQVPVTKEVQVQVCKMVPKLVPYTYNPCAGMNMSAGSMGATMGGGPGSNGYGFGGSAVSGPATPGCGCAGTVAPAPAANGCGCGN